MAACSEDILCRDDFDAVLVISCFYRYGANVSKAVEKIDIDEKEYHKCFLCITVCIATTYIDQSRNRKNCLLRTHPDS